MTPVLAAHDVVVEVETPRGRVRALDGVTLTVAAGEAVALVGESGAGKSLLAAALGGTLPPGAHLAGGRIEYRGRSLTDARAWAAVRGRRVATVPQDPFTALAPARSVGGHLRDVLAAHRGLHGPEADVTAAGLLETLHLAPGLAWLRRYPHALSGGQRQRVLVALALAAEPDVLVADEPAAALDHALRDALVALLAEARAARDAALLLVTHDLPALAGSVDRVVVLHAGEVVEAGPVAAVMAAPRHPYTAALLRCAAEQAPGALPAPLPAPMPALGAWPVGCRFAARCDLRHERCAAPPGLVGVTGHAARCWLAGAAG